MTEEKKEYIRENGFIVIGLTYLFELMEKISIFYFIRWIGKRIGRQCRCFFTKWNIFEFGCWEI